MLVLLVARSRSVLRGRAYILVNRILAIALLVFAVIFMRGGVIRLLGI